MYQVYVGCVSSGGVGMEYSEKKVHTYDVSLFVVRCMCVFVYVVRGLAYTYYTWW